MSARLVADAVTAARQARDAQTAHALRHAVGDFIGIIGAVPDEQAHSLSAGDTRLLQSLGQDVIDGIEEHVASSANDARAQSLVISIYEIRRLLEEVDRWHRHYSVARHV